MFKVNVVVVVAAGVMLATAGFGVVFAASWTNVSSSGGQLFVGPNAQALIARCSHPRIGNADSVWTPSRNELDQADAVLDQFLKRGMTDEWARTSSSIRRQYAGFNANGRRFIYIAGRRTRPDDVSWKLDPCSGGEISYAAAYELGAREITYIASREARSPSLSARSRRSTR